MQSRSTTLQSADRPNSSSLALELRRPQAELQWIRPPRQVRTQLSFVLQGVLCQTLVPRSNGRGRALCCEIMVANQAVKSCIRENKAHQIYSIVQTGGKYGMKTMNQSLFELYQDHEITFDEAMSRTSDPEDLKRTFQRGGLTPEKHSAATARRAGMTQGRNV